MNKKTGTYRLRLFSVFFMALAWATGSQAQVSIDGDDIGGVVTGPNGPEAGVWVIAETDEFDTFYAKIVVTDDMGRYVVPDLPDADYDVWVRGYGLVDSNKMDANPGDTVNLDAIIAPNAAAAAEIYPAIAWFSMLHMPTDEEVSRFEGGMDFYRNRMNNNGCIACHMLGNKATREISPEFGEELIRGLPYYQDELDNLLQMANHDWEDFSETFQGTADEDSLENFVISHPQEGAESFNSSLEGFLEKFPDAKLERK